MRLCEAALTIARQVLTPAGIRLQDFQGEDFRSSRGRQGRVFGMQNFQTQSCRKASKEIYLIGKGKKTGGPHVRS